ncbi:MAG: hypothetical protein M0P69_13520 [Bacteroidales bacterium]|jgi:hypothetical protein|nr:hypothetical protein [Bacteroidales bacterium]MDD2571354.1 hypothetical protein [Bacteroidales bacterium]MDD2813859.1 hypothetical protein [Bacteroidales bacterium]MDD3385338.1 hypothetical protein [Bacteroidales bacterium]MDD3811931.1 hypothetical protein [Bacteroidales bacterium]
MISNRLSSFLLSAVLLLFYLGGAAQELTFSGQASLLHVSKFSDPYQMVNGLRYIPELKGSMPLSHSLVLEGELSANGWLNSYFIAPDSLGFDGSIKPYRMWGRLSGDRFDVRLGLQKINFGSATMLRPLMWFDRLDPRDPLQLTDGVYGALVKYFFPNNANIWLWGLLGNGETKGWELIPGMKWIPEAGFRIQHPAGPGEVALSGHFRQIDPQRSMPPFTGNPAMPEYRIGLDGKWDLGAGLWFEGCWTWTDLQPDLMNHTRAMTLGADYTWGIGNGLTSAFEQFLYSTAAQPWESGVAENFSALMLNYPVNLIHSVSGMLYFHWRDRSWYRFLSWQMRFDHLSLNLIGFWNPNTFEIFRTTGNSDFLAGKGLQIVLIYHH